MTKTSAPLLTLLGITLFVTACETGYKKSPVVTPQRMSCSGSVPAQITLFSPEDARLNFEGKNYDLRRQQTASGVKYANSAISFWNKGIDAMITRGDGSMTTCTYIPKSGL